MRHHKTKYILIVSVCCLLAVLSAVWIQVRPRKLRLVNVETGEVYVDCWARPGDELSFEWQHSFEHTAWNEYYRVEKDGEFLLQTISVAGFGAGIPAEMDCSYRYQDGLIYMDGINSRFSQFQWINSQTALQNIKLNGSLLVTGKDMPHHKKMILYIGQAKQ